MRTKYPPLVSFKFSVILLTIYFFVFIPIWKVIFSSSSSWSNYHFEIFSFTIFIWLISSSKKFLEEELYDKKSLIRNIFISIGLGIFIILSILGSTYLFSSMAMDNGRYQVGMPVYPILGHYSKKAQFIKILTFTIIEQIVFIEVFVKPLMHRYNRILAIYLSSIVFLLLNLKFFLGYFGLGLICSFLFGLTRSIFPAIIFHMFLCISKFLLIEYFPESIPLLNFFF